ncbi:uncharacterized, partial [Tachysurus ichikawai]
MFVRRNKEAREAVTSLMSSPDTKCLCFVSNCAAKLCTSFCVTAAHKDEIRIGSKSCEHPPRSRKWRSSGYKYRGMA